MATSLFKKAAIITTDTIRSIITGLGDPTEDKAAAAYIQNAVYSDLYYSNLYRNSWVFQKAIEIPVDDATRKWRIWGGDPKAVETIEKAERDLRLRATIRRAMIAARIWGGAAVYIGTDDPNLEAPLDPAKLPKDGIKYLTYLNHRDVSVDQQVIDPASEYYGDYEFYTINQGHNANENLGVGLKIHASRFVIFKGKERADPFFYHIGDQYSGANYWGDSIIKAIYEACLRVELTAGNMATLISEANVDSLGIPDLMLNIQKDPSGKYAKQVRERLDLAAKGKGTVKTLVHDSDEVYARHNYTFAGLSDVLTKFLEMTCAAVDIPMTRFLGQSPGGLNSTGEGDLNNYYDKVSASQELEIGPRMAILDRALVASALGRDDETVQYSWSPLKQMTEQQLAEIAFKQAEVAVKLASTGIVTPMELREAVLKQFSDSGFYPEIDANAEDPDALAELEKLDAMMSPRQEDPEQEGAGEKPKDEKPKAEKKDKPK